ncbi:4'-phosphopantetheinyl transferase family protein [Rhodopirellula halodulae]|uniref:4'-phosphopantetheinyl transferase family protein n=1 Tax=Rhodopirellula halodulae TaxID=2894198 RepID=UPI001E388ED6|nr:4'-phosphopantetheinyl transferase superfamily protein [Rhodopirellula sp. JC737]MCC9655475.1 4'-phosphopantetheinyl transferase superfamily protein [Rhodopirellula sp. JC737]
MPATSELCHIQLWYASAAEDTPGKIETFCMRWLAQEEHQSAAKFKVASARHQHVIGRGMARYLLAGDQTAPHQIQFRHLDHGKPIVEHPTEMRRPFNIAHTKGLVLCGLGTESADHWLGVDVEGIQRKTDPGLANRYFAPEEIEQLERTKTSDAKQFLFLKIWTLKEAFIKAIGTGLQTPLDQFAFENANSNTPTLKLKDPSLAQGRHWQVRSVTPRQGYIAAVAIGTDRSNLQPKIELADFRQKMQNA